MAYEQKPNNGSIFLNKKKDKETQPDKQGKLLVCCPSCSHEQLYWVSAWDKIAKDSGDPWISLAIKAAEEKKAKPPEPQYTPTDYVPAPEPQKPKTTPDLVGDKFPWEV